MINILLEGFDIDAPWLYDELKNYIQLNHSVAVVAFSFRDNRVKSFILPTQRNLQLKKSRTQTSFISLVDCRTE